MPTTSRNASAKTREKDPYDPAPALHISTISTARTKASFRIVWNAVSFNLLSIAFSLHSIDWYWCSVRHRDWQMESRLHDNILCRLESGARAGPAGEVSDRPLSDKVAAIQAALHWTMLVILNLP